MEGEGTWSTGPPCHWSSFRPSGDALDAQMKNFNLREGGEIACCLLWFTQFWGPRGFVIHTF